MNSDNRASADERALVETEHQRCQAVNDSDWAVLDSILGEDFVYAHSNGRAENKADQVASLQKRRRTMKRENLAVRLYGDVGVMTGTMIMRFEDDGYADRPNLDLMQVWVRRAGSWQLVAHHGTKISPRQ